MTTSAIQNIHCSRQSQEDTMILGSPPTNPHTTPNVTFSECFRLWWSVSSHSLQITSFVLIFIVVLFVPALSLDLSDDRKLFELIYQKVALSLEVLLFYLFVAIFVLRAFGFRLARGPLFYWYIPLGIISIVLSIFGVLGGLGDQLDIVGVVVFGILIRYRKPPPHSTIDQRNLYMRKDRLMPPIIKTVGVISIIFTMLQFIYSAFLKGGFASRMIIRFIVVPSLWMVGSAMQFRITKHTLIEFREYWIPFIWILSGTLKIWERLFTNAMFDAHEYEKLVFVSFIAALFEVVAHATYFQRALFLQTLWRRILHKTETILSRKIRNIDLGNAVFDPSRSFSSEFTDIELMKMMRSPMVIEDIVIEQEMMIVVPFLLYMSHPLGLDISFGIIKDYRVCLFQIGIQFAFEIISDVSAFYITIRYHGIPIKLGDVPRRDRWFAVKVIFLMWQTIGIFRWTVYAAG